MWQVALYGSLLLGLAQAKLLVSDGTEHVGRLVGITADKLTLEIDGAGVSFPVGDARKLVMTTGQVRKPQASCWVQLVDQSLLPAKGAVVTAGTATVTSLDGGEIRFASEHVRLIRWSGSEKQLDAQWDQILKSKDEGDILVIRRSQGNLDYLRGIVQSVAEGTVQFEYEGDTIPVPQARVDGIIFFHADSEYPSPRLRLMTVDGAVWHVDTAKLSNERVSLTTVSGATLEFDSKLIKQIDFSEANAVFLSDLEPIATSWTPYIQSPRLATKLAKMFQSRRDQTLDGSKLRLRDSTTSLGEREFDKGLAIHSRTDLVYRLGGQFRQFQAIAGIDPSLESGGSVRLVLSADGDVLFDQELTSEQAPNRIVVDVTRRKRLRILVDFGKGLDIGDRLNLCDARLIK